MLLSICLFSTDIINRNGCGRLDLSVFSMAEIARGLTPMTAGAMIMMISRRMPSSSNVTCRAVGSGIGITAVAAERRLSPRIRGIGISIVLLVGGGGRWAHAMAKPYLMAYFVNYRQNALLVGRMQLKGIMLVPPVNTFYPKPPRWHFICVRK